MRGHKNREMKTLEKRPKSYTRDQAILFWNVVNFDRDYFFFADKKSMNTIDNEKWIGNLVVQLNWLFSLVETEMIILFCLKNDKN